MSASFSTMNYDALVNADAFKKLTLKKAAKLGGLTAFGSEATVGDMLFRLNMVAIAWEIKHPKDTEPKCPHCGATDGIEWEGPEIDGDTASQRGICSCGCVWSTVYNLSHVEIHTEGKTL